jgi:hypothetical protein
LAPRFRIYQKKRGNRRTGSKALGSIGEAAFFTALFVLGCAGLVAIFATLVIPEYRANHVFVEHRCVVRDKQLARKETPDGTLFRPEIRIEYVVNQQTYVVRTYDIRQAFSAGEEDKQAILDQFEIGQQYPCWYDPADPKVAVLVRGYSWWFWLTFLVPASFVVIGGAGLVYAVLTWGKSAERRAAPAGRLGPRELPGRRARPKTEHPTLPDPANITNSPGTELAYRLPVASSTGVRLVVWLLAALGWNGMVAVLAVWAITGHLAGQPDWILTAFTLPFAIIGIGLLLVFLRQFLLTTGVGPTFIEISDQPLVPGKRYDLFLSQAGRLTVNCLEVLFVCEEEATYRHGTDARTEARRVYEQSVFRQERFEIRHGVPFEARFPIEVPVGAMHSFQSEHNEVNWRVIVKGDVVGWPSYERSFPVIVFPGNNGS